MRSGHAEDGSKHSEQCRERIEGEMRREEDPRIKRAEDKHTHFQEEVMQAKTATDKRAAKAARTRRGGDGEDIAPEHQNENGNGTALGHSSEGPVKSGREKDDHWRMDGDEIIRVHIKPRRALFTPSNSECPVPVKELSTKRRFNRMKVDDKEEEHVTDTWTNDERAHLLMPEKWAGETIFFRVSSEVAVPQTEAAKQGYKRKYMNHGSI